MGRANALRTATLRRGFALEYITLGWNVVGIFVLGYGAFTARSVALAGFGADSLIEIGASIVVIWELSGTGADRQRQALRLIDAAFAALAVYLMIQSTWVLAVGYRPRHSLVGIALPLPPRRCSHSPTAKLAPAGNSRTRSCPPRAA